MDMTKIKHGPGEEHSHHDLRVIKSERRVPATILGLEKGQTALEENTAGVEFAARYAGQAVQAAAACSPGIVAARLTEMEELFGDLLR